MGYLRKPQFFDFFVLLPPKGGGERQNLVTGGCLYTVKNDEKIFTDRQM
jgi:hypothetical protein